MANINNGILINYIRLSLILGVVSAISILLITYIEIELSVLTGICVFGVLLFSIPGYLILPGIIYDEFKTGMVFTLDQMFYFAFMILVITQVPAQDRTYNLLPDRRYPQCGCCI